MYMNMKCSSNKSSYTQVEYLDQEPPDVKSSPNVSISVKPEGEGTPAYRGHLIFKKYFWSKSLPVGPKMGKISVALYI